jgi:CPA2 family monovalent cation:H+ antiporter-2
MLLPAIALAVVTALTKIAVGIWAARRAKIAVAGQIRAGTAIVSRGEFNIVIAGLATGSGIIAPGFAALAAAYVLILAITGPLIARAGEPVGRTVARRLTARRERRAREIREAAAAQAANEDGAMTEPA